MHPIKPQKFHLPNNNNPFSLHEAEEREKAPSFRRRKNFFPSLPENEEGGGKEGMKSLSDDCIRPKNVKTQTKWELEISQVNNQELHGDKRKKRNNRDIKVRILGSTLARSYRECLEALRFKSLIRIARMAIIAYIFPPFKKEHLLSSAGEELHSKVECLEPTLIENV
ncbi:hypothetical protein CEXT_680111 [Caerostris extrusa]|uniref:Uncharacterized protein n=1 Tax=Caerostris extrusa TaxID=172846 RepID=A0AAV4VB66_CAEEX|nr:hypothetical protein CEXT_680111 [Caerostris extrusa]